jgi:Ca2+-binding RTX toxin-like protein
MFTLRVGDDWIATERTSQVVSDAGSINIPVSFGEDARGDLFVVDYDGEVFRLTPIVVSAGGDQIEGFGGDDTLLGGAGNDSLSGGTDNDLIYGNQGTDVIYGNLGQDTGYGGQVNDTIYGGQVNDVVYGNFGNDIVYGNFGDDFVFGGQDADRLFGGQGNDTINGNLGNDTLSGNLGADRFVFGLGSGSDVVMNFNFAEGDRLDVQAQTHVTSTAASGWALITLSGSGTIEMVGLTPSQIDDSFFV